ncbi:MAG: phosphoglycerate kinase [Armatimonadetes bacterium]|nr:phosphoglycerate kinase [Armatimonadota bacterium]
MKKQTLRDLDVAHKRVLVREDLNVPLDSQGNITDDRRIEAAVPTLKYLMDHHAKVIVAAHLGRPKGKRDEKYSLKPVATRLCELLGAPVKLAPDSAGPDVEQLAKELKNGGGGRAEGQALQDAPAGG